MKLGRLVGKIVAIVLSVALVQVPYGFARQDDIEQQRLETCRRLLESIGREKPTSALTTHLTTSHEVQRVVDLSDADLNRFSAAASKAKADDILVINDHSLADPQVTSALASSPALFTVAASAGAASVNPILQSRAGRPEIVVAIPTNALGVEKVFGVPASESAPTVKYLGQTAEKFRALRNSQVLNYPLHGQSIADNLMSKAEQQTPNPLVVVAHNERGTLKMPDGSSIRVDALYRALGNRIGVVLSCDTIRSETPPTNALLTNRALDFKDVASGLASAEHLLSARPDLSLGSLLLAFTKSIPTGESSVARTVKIIAMVSGGLIVIGLLYYWICEDTDNPPAICGRVSKPTTTAKEGKK
jgi:hypothetical protein